MGCLAFSVLMISTAATSVFATIQTESVHEAPSYYCGLFCVYAVAEERGLDVDFESLIDPELLTGQFGSSVGDIVRALDRCGVKGYPRAGMTIEQLSSASHPVLLHVATPMAGNAYRHWVLYLGTDETGQMNIYDPPRDQGVLSAAELLSVWDGIAVMTEPPSVETMAPNVQFLAAALLTIIGACLFGKRLSPCVLVLSLTTVICVVAGVLPGTGIMRSPLTLGSVQARFFEASFPEIGYERLQEQLESPHVLIDARPKNAYAYRHIPGAINVPVNSGFLSFCNAAQSLDNEVPVVLYCQSEGCTWGDSVARQLQGRGVRNIHIYRGGMNDWDSRQQ